MDLTALAKQQETLAKLVRIQDDPPYTNPIVTGIDVAYTRNIAAGCAVVRNNHTKEIIDTLVIIREIESDYISGFFQLREGPIVIELIQYLETHGTILVDGNGILHPRRFGLASYLGIKEDVQTIGVAKKLMLGELGPRTGDSAEIIQDCEVLGKVLWLNEKKPIYVSIGHRITLDTAVKIVSESSVDGYPEALRQAHKKAKDALNRYKD